MKTSNNDVRCQAKSVHVCKYLVNALHGLVIVNTISIADDAIVPVVVVSPMSEDNLPKNHVDKATSNAESKRGGG